MPKRVVTPPSNRKGHHHAEQTAAVPTPGRGGEGAEQGSSRPSSPFPTISLRRTRFSSVPLVHIKHADLEEISFPASVELPRRHVTFYSDVDSDSSLSGGGLCSMSDTMESFKELGSSSQPSVRIKHLTRNSDGTSRFPKLDECAHFHYDNVELGPITVVLCDGEETRVEASKCSNASVQPPEFCVQVTSNGKSWQIRRSLDNFQMLDRQLHRCVYDRKFSLLQEIDTQQQEDAALRTMLTHYLDRFSQLAGSLINCGPVLNWLELDNRGNRLIVTDEAAINTPAVAAAYVVKRYASQATDEISLEVGDIISVIDMPPPEESSWWRGKKGFQVGFFPCECVEIIGDKVPQSIKIPKAPAKPVLRKHGKLIAFFRSFLLTRPSRRKLKQSGILKERVFGCDLGEHLMNSGRDIPLVLKCCTEFIEQYGIVDGIYRLSGVTSNIQKLRIAFDEDRIPNLLDEAILQDIHCVASLLKMYFRELPNPLLTFHLYDKFVNAVQADEDMRLLKLRDVVQQLPPPHYRSLEYLMRHLSKVAAFGFQTGMTPKNVAIVWAPNLLRSRDIENGGVGALHVVGVQAVLTEYLIRYTDIIFNEKMPIFPSPKLIEVETPKKTRPKSLAISTPTKLLSLEEARSRALSSNLPGEQQKFIDVGGGEENLPIKYHTVIELPSRRRSMGKGKKSPSGWKSLFSRGWHTSSGRRKNRHLRGEGGERPKIGCPIFSEHSSLVLKDKAITESDVPHTNTKRLRTVKSAEALFPLVSDSCHLTQESVTIPSEHNVSSQVTQYDSFQEDRTFSCQRHIRSSSHDSYFERIMELHNSNDSAMEETSFDGFVAKDLQKVVAYCDVEQMTKSALQTNLNSPVRQGKTAQKQKLVSFESEASSPKLQKLSLKRLYHTLSSPPMVKKETSKKDKCLMNSNSSPVFQNERTENQCLELSTDGNLKSSVPLTVHSSSEGEFQHNMNSKDKDSVSVEIHSQACSSSAVSEDTQVEKDLSLADDSEDPVNFSMEATISDSASLSQLLSFDSRDQSIYNPENLEHSSGCNWIPPDSSLATPESPTGDNVSDIPSSGSSGNSGSISDVNKNNLVTDSFMAEVENRHIANHVDRELKSGNEMTSENFRQSPSCDKSEHFKAQPAQKYSDENLNNNLKLSDVSDSVRTIVNSDIQSPVGNDFVDNVILSPPASFGDKQKSSPQDAQTKADSAADLVTEIKASAKSPCARTMERSKTEVHEICPKFVSGIAISGSFAQDLFRATNDSGESFHKKRSCSDKLSPISPIEESKRKFESEIGRLIVRDRQMKLEMEQMKAERQKCRTEISTFSDSDKNKSKSDKKFADAVEFRKSPIKSFDSDKKKSEYDDLLKTLRDDKKTGDIPSQTCSRFVRLENKPSVKELLSKFERHKEEDSSYSPKFYTDNIIPLQKQSSGIFSNVQVINHNYPLMSSRSLGSNCNFGSNAKDNQSKENIFQTECIIRFPHPKTSPLWSQTSNKTDNRNIIVHEYGESNSWSSGQYDHSIDKDNSKSSFTSSDNLLVTSPKPDVSSSLSSIGTKSSNEFPWMTKSMGSDCLTECLRNDKELTDNGKFCDASGSIHETGKKFSSFKDSFNRANKALQMKNEFLKRGLPLTDNEDKATEAGFFSLESDRFSRSPLTGECRKRHAQTRQRPKSVPPPTCRLSFVSSKGSMSALSQSPVTFNDKQASRSDNVPKTSNASLTNGKESIDSSQPYGFPKRVKERAAIFERSLSFSGSMERSPLSCNHPSKAQMDSSTR